MLWMKAFKIRMFWYVNLMVTSVMVIDTFSHWLNQPVTINNLPRVHELLYLVLSERTENTRVLRELVENIFDAQGKFEKVWKSILWGNSDDTMRALRKVLNLLETEQNQPYTLPYPNISNCTIVLRYHTPNDDNFDCQVVTLKSIISCLFHMWVRSQSYKSLKLALNAFFASTHIGH